MNSTPDETCLINDNIQLRKVVQAVSKAKEIALDTEADSMHAYPEKICLLQIRINETSWLVDPLSDIDCAPLMEVLKDKPLIFHAADYDLRLLFKRFGFRPTQVFDTMWAARMAGHERFGLEFLVKHYFNVQLEKGPQTANWGIRPLTPVMAHYALNDVFYLHRLTDLLREELNKLGRLAWVQEISQKVIEQACLPEQDVSDREWRLKGSQKMARRELTVLKAIWYWREKEAVRANRPPFFILNHDLCITIAGTSANNEDWAKLLPRRMSPRRRQGLEKVINNTFGVNPSEFPSRVKTERFRATDEEKRRADQLKVVRDQAAESLKLDPSIIASKALLTRLGLNDAKEATDGLMQWQRKLLKL
ncbi:ribonuclease D [bacterium]|nr:ribonuclease D [bacterium]